MADGVFNTIWERPGPRGMEFFQHRRCDRCGRKVMVVSPYPDNEALECWLCITCWGEVNPGIFIFD